MCVCSPLAVHLEHTDWAGRGLCRLIVRAAVPQPLNAEIAAVDPKAIAALNGLSDAVLLDVSFAAGGNFTRTPHPHHHQA